MSDRCGKLGFLYYLCRLKQRRAPVSAFIVDALPRRLYGCMGVHNAINSFDYTPIDAYQEI